MIQLSVVMVMKNAEKLLDIVLKQAAQVADEIVIVDAGSTDQSLDIAKRYSATIIQQEWLGFGKQKQKAVDASIGAWILVLDADEVLTDELIASIKSLKNAEFKVPYQAYEIKRPLVFAGKVLRRSISLWTLRLFKRGCGRFNEALVHETLMIEGSIGRIFRGEMRHYSYLSVSDWVDRMQRYTDLSIPEQVSSIKATVSFALLSASFTFIKIYFLKAGFLEGRLGLVLAINWAISNYLKYLKWALKSEFKILD